MSRSSATCLRGRASISCASRWRWVVQQLMEAEVSELVGAARGERAPEERLTHRNGYRARPWATRAGEIELAIPKLRRGSYFPSFLEPRRRSEQALVGGRAGGVRRRRLDAEGRPGGRVARAADLEERGLADLRRPGRAGRRVPQPAARGPLPATSGWTRRSRRSATAAASCARRWCSPTACTSPATAR